MEAKTDAWALTSVNRRKPRIDPNPPWQRPPVWSPEQKQLLIDSILRGYDIPKLYLLKLYESPYQWQVIDGQQRLRAIWEFYADEYALAKDGDSIGGDDCGNMKFSHLSDELQDTFEAYNLHMVVISDASQDEVEDMFLRLQNGIPLNAAEKRNAIGGEMRGFIHDLSINNRFFKNCLGFTNKRYSYDELAAQMVLLELNGGRPMNARDKNLREMYKDQKQFDTNGTVAKRVRSVLNYTARAFPAKTPELTKVNTLSLYLLTSQLIQNYVMSGKESALANWFIEFEKKRRLDEDKDVEQRDPEMVEYQLKLSQATASLDSVQYRQEILLRDFMLCHPDLEQLDDQRIFSHEQRLAIYRKYDGICVNPESNPDCEIQCNWNSFHADHIKPHNKGGKTTVANGQLLCPNCNFKKGARF